MNPKKVKNQKNCHAEPCAELDSVLIQHLTKLVLNLFQYQGLTRP
jgi:hypothetical protein